MAAQGGVHPKPVEFTLEIYKDPLKCNTSPDFGLQTGSRRSIAGRSCRRSLHFKTVRQTGGPGDPARQRDVGRPREVACAAGDRRHLRPRPVAESIRRAAQVAQIVKFENEFFSAQYIDRQARLARSAGATGGPVHLSGRSTRSPPASRRRRFDEYNSWANLTGSTADDAGLDRARADDLPQQAADGRQCRRVQRSLRPQPGLRRTVFPVTCQTCHDMPHAGSELVPPPQRDIGVGGRRRRASTAPQAAQGLGSAQRRRSTADLQVHLQQRRDRTRSTARRSSPTTPATR